jgi:HPt (histidine-containing phosphotransfer) domain-containing protein
VSNYHCLAAGMSQVVAKPIDLGRLRAAVAGLTRPGDAEPIAAANHTAVAVFDPTTCREMFAGNAAEGREWLALYLDTAARLVRGIDRNAASGDREALAEDAHKLASASLAVGAMCLGWLGRRLEAAAPEAPAPEMRELAVQVVTAWRNAQQAIGVFVTLSEALV